MVSAGQREQADLGEAGGLQAALDHGADRGDASLADRAGDHARLAEAAAARAAAEDLHAVALVDRLSDRDDRGLRVRPGVEVEQRVLAHAGRDSAAVGGDLRDTAVGVVGDVVELRHVDAAGSGESQQQAVAPAGAAALLPASDDASDSEHSLLAVADDHRVKEVGQGLGVERGVAAREHHRVGDRAVPRFQGDASQVEGGQKVRVAELGGEGHAEDVERANRAVRVHGELRDFAVPHQLFHVGPDAVGALGQHTRLLVQDLVQDGDALVGLADLIRVGVEQGPADIGLIPCLDGGIHLAPDILHRLANLGQQGL